MSNGKGNDMLGALVRVASALPPHHNALLLKLARVSRNSTNEDIKLIRAIRDLLWRECLTAEFDEDSWDGVRHYLSLYVTYMNFHGESESCLSEAPCSMHGRYDFVMVSSSDLGGRSYQENCEVALDLGFELCPTHTVGCLAKSYTKSRLNSTIRIGSVLTPAIAPLGKKKNILNVFFNGERIEFESLPSEKYQGSLLFVKPQATAE